MAKKKKKASVSKRENIQARVGKLTLENGFPTKDTASKLYDEIDFARATQAFIWALPAVGFHALHLAHLKYFGAQDGDVVLYQDLKDRAGMLTPNITTLYVFSFWNMKEKGPLVVETLTSASPKNTSWSHSRGSARHLATSVD